MVPAALTYAPPAAKLAVSPAAGADQQTTSPKAAFESEMDTSETVAALIEPGLMEAEPVTIAPCPCKLNLAIWNTPIYQLAPGVPNTP